MILKIFPIISNKFMKNIHKSFPTGYIESFADKPFPNESLIARLKISQDIWDNYLPQTKEGIPEYQDENYWSLSHKKNLVFTWVSHSPIGVDIEVYKIRDESLLNTFTVKEYHFIWWRSWRNFYLLWTIHESIIKYEREKKYFPGMYVPVSIQEKKHTISEISFQYIFTFWKDWKKYTISSAIKDNYIYSVCY